MLFTKALLKTVSPTGRAPWIMYGGGEKYVGGFAGGSEEGEGILYKGGIPTPVLYRRGVLQVYQKSVVIGGNESTEKVPGCLAGNCRNGYGEMKFPSGNIYKGGFENMQFSGAGEMKFAGGNFIKATFKNHIPLRGTFYYADVKTFFAGTFNADGTPNTGTYTSPGIDGIVEVTTSKITAERHPVRDSINAAARKHALEYSFCTACEGKGQYQHSSYTPFKREVRDFIRTDGSGNLERVISFGKSTGGFSQWMGPCEVCNGKGALKRR